MGSIKVKSSLLYKNFHNNPALVIDSASGIYLNIKDGRQILDATSGAAVACLGYGNKEVQEAMNTQMNTISYCHPGFYKTEVAEELADFLVDSTDGMMSKAILCGSGKSSSTCLHTKRNRSLTRGNRIGISRGSFEALQNLLCPTHSSTTNTRPIHRKSRSMAWGNTWCFELG